MSVFDVYREILAELGLGGAKMLEEGKRMTWMYRLEMGRCYGATRVVMVSRVIVILLPTTTNPYGNPYWLSETTEYPSNKRTLFPHSCSVAVSTGNPSYSTKIYTFEISATPITKQVLLSKPQSLA